MSRRIVITGIGLVTPIGIGKDEFWPACQKGVSGVDRIAAFDPSGFSTQIAAQLNTSIPPLFPPELLENVEPVHLMGLAGARMAFEDAGLDLSALDRRRMAISVGSGMGTRLVSEQRLYAAYHSDPGTGAIPLPKKFSLGDYIADYFRSGGATCNFSNACATGNHAVGWGFNLLRMGAADVAIAGGAEAAILPLTTAGFCAMRAMSRRNQEPSRASRPFDRERDGFVLGEGAGLLVLETLENARKRNARIYAEIVGYSMTGEAYHMALPDPEVTEIIQAMQLALDDRAVSARRTSTTSTLTEHPRPKTIWVRPKP